MSNAAEPDDDVTETVTSRRWLVLVAMTIANAMVLVDQTAVPLILPSVMNELDVASAAAQWVLNGSLLPLAGLLVFGGRLGDLAGRRKIFAVGSLIFALASACAGLSPTFAILIVFRILQGIGGALMLPTTIAIVSAAYPGRERGRALGAMGGAAAVAGAFGPMIGGGLTAALGWRSVLLVNVPLAALALAAAFIATSRDRRPSGRGHVDMLGTIMFSITLIAFVFGLSQSQSWSWTSIGVIGPIVLSIVTAVAFVLVERRSHNPLLDLRLLRRHPNYLGATISQSLAGMAEMGLGVLFPLLLILNLGMSPAMAGLALVPATVPMIVVAPLTGRWYDKAGGRMPLTVGFAVLAASGIMLGLAVHEGVHSRDYWLLFPGLLVYGIGLALVLTVNDPVSLDTVPERDHGQASGVSATAEQFGGALGIAVLYLIFHAIYVNYLFTSIDNAPITDLTDKQAAQLRDGIVAAEQTGLNPDTFDHNLLPYLVHAYDASTWGMSAAFFTVSLLAIVGVIASARLVSKPPPETATPRRPYSAKSLPRPASGDDRLAASHEEDASPG